MLLQIDILQISLGNAFCYVLNVNEAHTKQDIA